jgi:hypothetical protein
VKKLYLCNNCKKMGVRSSKAKVFEEFYCPKCQKNTTLFLPTVKIDKPKVVVEEKSVPITQPDITPITQPNRTPRKPLFTLWDCFMFMLGFISALLIMKI